MVINLFIDFNDDVYLFLNSLLQNSLNFPLFKQSFLKLFASFPTSKSVSELDASSFKLIFNLLTDILPLLNANEISIVSHFIQQTLFDPYFPLDFDESIQTIISFLYSNNFEFQSYLADYPSNLPPITQSTFVNSSFQENILKFSQSFEHSEPQIFFSLSDEETFIHFNSSEFDSSSLIPDYFNFSHSLSDSNINAILKSLINSNKEEPILQDCVLQIISTINQSPLMSFNIFMNQELFF
jgi:hypothetical protein